MNKGGAGCLSSPLLDNWFQGEKRNTPNGTKCYFICDGSAEGHVTILWKRPRSPQNMALSNCSEDHFSLVRF